MSLNLRMAEPDKQFVYQLTDWQTRLLSYLFTLLGDIHDARDVLQETNLVLWKKHGEGEPVLDFGAWAIKCAYFQALAFLRDRKRDPHLFDDELLDLFAEVTTREPDEDRHLALRDCLSRLPAEQRGLLQERYCSGKTVRELAAEQGKKESAMRMLMMRIRDTLRVCIESKLREIHP